MHNEIVIDSSDIARAHNIKHSEVVRILLNLEAAVSTVGSGRKCFIVPVNAIYRGNQYVKYEMDMFTYLMLLTRMKTSTCLERLMHYFMMNEHAQEIEDLLLDKYDTLEEEVQALRIYKDVCRTNIAIGNKQRKCSKKEQLIHMEIVQNFTDYFPEYVYKRSEYELPDGDVADILAECKHTACPVIMELKVNPISAHKQLRSYAVHFDSPILVNVTETLVPRAKRVEGVIYKCLSNLKKSYPKKVKTDLNRWM